MYQDEKQEGDDEEEAEAETDGDGEGSDEDALNGVAPTPKRRKFAQERALEPSLGSGLWAVSYVSRNLWPSAKP